MSVCYLCWISTSCSMSWGCGGFVVSTRCPLSQLCAPFSLGVGRYPHKSRPCTLAPLLLAEYILSTSFCLFFTPQNSTIETVADLVFVLSSAYRHSYTFCAYHIPPDHLFDDLRSSSAPSPSPISPPCFPVSTPTESTLLISNHIPSTSSCLDDITSGPSRLRLLSPPRPRSPSRLLKGALHIGWREGIPPLSSHHSLSNRWAMQVSQRRW